MKYIKLKSENHSNVRGVSKMESTKLLSIPTKNKDKKPPKQHQKVE